MKLYHRFFLYLAVLGCLCPVSAAARFRYILATSPTGNIDDILKRHDLKLTGPLDGEDRGIFLVTCSKAPKDLLPELNSDLEVADAETDGRMGVAESPLSLNQTSVAILDNMPPPVGVPYFGNNVLELYTTQPAAQLIRLAEAQTAFAITGGGIVAVIDTGIDPDHLALAGTVIPGYDFVHKIPGGSEMIDLDAANLQVLQNSDPDPGSKTEQILVNQTSVAILDDTGGTNLDPTKLPPAFGHGTMVAGVVHLLAPTAQIMPLKAFQGDGTARLSNILQAIYYASDHGAKVINMSFSLLKGSKELPKAIGYAHNKKVILAASTGNTGKSKVASPARLNKVMGVASTTDLDARSDFSAYGTGTFVATPGEEIITLYPGNNYAVASGTSFSSPMVAGTSALVVQVDPLAEQSDAGKAVSHAKPLGPELGAGRLDVYQAMDFATHRD